MTGQQRAEPLDVDEYVRRVVAGAPDFTSVQKVRLRALLAEPEPTAHVRQRRAA